MSDDDGRTGAIKLQERLQGARRRPLVKSGGPRALFALQQLALALEPPTVAGYRTVLLDDAMARHEDCNGIAGDRLGYLSRIARAQFGCHSAVVRHLAHGHFAQHRPDTDLIRRPAQIKRNAGNKTRLFDCASRVFDNTAQSVLAVNDVGLLEANTQRLFDFGVV